MDNWTDDARKGYEPLIKEVENLIGLSMNAGKEGDEIKVLPKSFLTSHDDNHRHCFGQVLAQFLGGSLDNLNRVLVVIRDNKAHIYRNYPEMLEIIPKVDIQMGRAVFENQVLDITAVKFKDAVFDLDVRDGDKFLWLFRRGWSFGLYFDFSGEMKTVDLWKELGRCYRKLEFHSLYLSLSVQENFDILIDRGWFPFVQILGNEFDKLRLGIDDAKGMEIAEDEIVGSFTPERIDQFTEYWWRNEIFRNHRTIITAGVDAYKKGGPDDIINCIKNLATEIEGVIRLDYHRAREKKPSTCELKNYVLSQGKSKFSSPESLGFPGLFFNYLDKVFFRQFDIESGDVRLARPSVAHGVADGGEYTKMRALQLILTLDQIYFYLS